MQYVHWLALLSIIFVVLERIWPRHDQPIFRAGILTDLFYLAFNGHFLGVLLATATVPLVAVADPWLLEIGVQRAVAGSWPPWLQFAVALLVIDLVEWCIHNMLHRVPALWELHKIHHSIVTMDWIGSLRFHWGEVLVYKSIRYPLLAFFGFDGGVLLTLGIVATAIGHFNHSNLRITIGPLKYLLNNPEMHVWHHNSEDDGPPLYNFGINLSLWDWLFKTAHLPPAPPKKLGFDTIGTLPKTVVGQLVHPLPLERALRR